MIVVPRSILDECTKRLNAVSEVGQRLVLNALANAEWTTVAELREIMDAVMEQVCSVVADDASVIASETYDDIRELCLGVRLGTVPDSVYDPAATEGAVRALLKSVGDTGTTDVFGRQLAARVDYEVKRAAGNATYRMGATDSSDVRFARVPQGSETCPFCIMLASRGPVYHTATTAGSDYDGHYHSNCDCRVTPFFETYESGWSRRSSESMSVEGYDYEGMYKRYEDCVDALDSDWLWRSYQNLPESDRDDMPFDEYRTKQILVEMRTRDPLWLSKGVVPEPTFATDSLMNEILGSRSHELRTAKRICENGVRADFVDDSAGLADFANGYEIKTLLGTRSENTINDYLKRTSRKKNAVAVVFDNYENDMLSDSELSSMLTGLRAFHRGRVYVIGKTGKLMRAK